MSNESPFILKGEKHKCSDCYLLAAYCNQEKLREYRKMFDECFVESFTEVVGNPPAKLSDPTDEQFKKISDKAISKYHDKIEKMSGKEKVKLGGKASLNLELKITNQSYNHVKKIDDASGGALERNGSFKVETEPSIADNRRHSIIVTECPLYNLCAEEN